MPLQLLPDHLDAQVAPRGSPIDLILSCALIEFRGKIGHKNQGRALDTSPPLNLQNLLLGFFLGVHHCQGSHVDNVAHFVATLQEVDRLVGAHQHRADGVGVAQPLQ